MGYNGLLFASRLWELTQECKQENDKISAVGLCLCDQRMLVTSYGSSLSPNMHDGMLWESWRVDGLFLLALLDLGQLSALKGRCIPGDTMK